jgi:hypothetical protein
MRLISPERNRREYRPTVHDSLESRVVLSAARPSLASVVASAVGGAHSTAIPDVGPGDIGRILRAIRGGAGAEIVTALRRQGVNPLSIVGRFLSGQREVVYKGFAAKVPLSNPEFDGALWDQLNANITSAIFTNRGLSLSAMMRGPIDAPVYAQYVWAFDRGARSPALIQPFASRPSIQFDVAVVVTRQADGVVTAEVRDYVSGLTTPLDPATVRMDGPVVRLVVDPSLLPRQSLAQNKFRATFFVRTADDFQFSHVASVLPEMRSFTVGDIRTPRVRAN